MTNYDALIQMGLHRAFVADMFLDAFARKQKHNLHRKALYHCAQRRLVRESKRC